MINITAGSETWDNISWTLFHEFNSSRITISYKFNQIMIDIVRLYARMCVIVAYSVVTKLDAITLILEKGSNRSAVLQDYTLQVSHLVFLWIYKDCSWHDHFICDI